MKNTRLILFFLLILPGGITVTYCQKAVLANLTTVADQRAGQMAVEGDYTSSSNVKYLTNTLTGSGDNTPAPDSNFIGKSYEGGKIFWLDETGKHGLVAAIVDQSSKGIIWNPGQAVVTGAIADAMYAGKANTDKIISVQGKSGQYAAKLCKEFSTTVNNVVYTDWYLPSRYELNLLFKQHTVIGGFNTINGIYWSSTETTTEPGTQAWEQEFKLGTKYEDDKDLPDQVRCIRKF